MMLIIIAEEFLRKKTFQEFLECFHMENLRIDY